MSRFRLRQVISILVIVVLLVQTAAGQVPDSDPVLLRFRSEYPAAVAALQQRYAGLQIKSREFFTNDTTLDVWFRGSGESIRLDKIGVDFEDIIVRDGRQSQLIQRRSGWNEYRLTRTRQVNGLFTKLGGIASIPFAAIQLLDLEFLDLVNDPDVRIVGARNLEEGGVAQVRIDWERETHTEDGEPVTLTGHLQFEPENDWVVREWMYGNLKLDMDYAVADDGLPLIEKVTWSSRENDGEFVPGRTAEVIDVILEPADDEMFTLASLGIEEDAEAGSGEGTRAEAGDGGADDGEAAVPEPADIGEAIPAVPLLIAALVAMVAIVGIALRRKKIG